jgi:hypothetical protein
MKPISDEAAKSLRGRYSREAATALTRRDIMHLQKIRSFMTVPEQFSLTKAVRRGIDPSYKWLCKNMSAETMNKINKFLEEVK